MSKLQEVYEALIREMAPLSESYFGSQSFDCPARRQQAENFKSAYRDNTNLYQVELLQCPQKPPKSIEKSLKPLTYKLCFFLIVWTYCKKKIVLAIKKKIVLAIKKSIWKFETVGQEFAKFLVQ